MCQHCTAHFLHSGSLAEVITCLLSLEAEPGVAWSPCAPLESESSADSFRAYWPRVMQGEFCPGSPLHFALFQPLYVVT